MPRLPLLVLVLLVLTAPGLARPQDDPSYPGIYHTGISVAPVPDQRLYDTIYQERYQGLPDENPDAYEQGSPITFAEHLQGNLLLIHGTGDDNVHYQGMERLIDQLIALNKPFAMMAYPNRSHAISEGEGTSRHLYELMTRFLKANLPAGPQPSDQRSKATVPTPR